MDRQHAVNGRRSLTVDEILAAQDIEIVPVEVAEWGGTVYVRTVSAGQIQQIPEGDPARRLVEVFRMAVCDEGGKPLEFTKDQASALRTKSAAAMARVVNEFMRINRLRESDVDEAKKNCNEITSAVLS